MTALIGLAMIYAWVHGAIIVGNRVQNTSQYENVVLIFGGITLALYVFGTAF